MEELFHYIWKHKLFPNKPLFTDDGRSVEVIDTGLHNHDGGPDFFNAKIRIDGEMWVGNVELHVRSSEWYVHGHDRDAAYDNVILHVASRLDESYVRTSQGRLLPQLLIPIPEKLSQDYFNLLRDDRYPRCYRSIPDTPRLTIHSWLSALMVERLSRKVEDIQHRLDETCGSWEDAYFHTLARNFGFGVNGDAFETWARNIPLNSVAHHADDLMQIEAFFLGQAGLLDINTVPERHREQTDADLYFHRLASEYRYLAHKFSLTPMDRSQWKFLRLRPQNFPYVRLSQLANLFFNHRAGFSDILQCTSPDDFYRLFDTEATDYWQSHYVFGEECDRKKKVLTKASIDVLIINTVAPILYAYGKQQHNEKYTALAIDLLEGLKPENNNIIRLWRECGVNVDNAADSQALIQLKKEYCDKKKCLYCRLNGLKSSARKA